MYGLDIIIGNETDFDCNLGHIVAMEKFLEEIKKGEADTIVLWRRVKGEYYTITTWDKHAGLIPNALTENDLL